MIVFVIGKGFSGQSHYVKGFLERTKKPFIVIDPNHEYRVQQRFFNVESLIDAAIEKRVCQRVAVSFSTLEEANELFAWDFHFSPHVLVVEEFHLYANAHSTPAPLQRIIRMGRHRGIHLIGISHRFIDMPQIILSQANGLVIFRQQSLRDLDAIARATNEEVATRVSNLPTHGFVEFNFNN